MPASIEFDKACYRLSQMPAPRGWTREQLVLGYADSLADIPSDVAVRVIERFLKGGYDPSEINPNFAPSPPALAVLCRKAAPKPEATTAGRLFAYRRSNSAVLAQGIQRDVVRDLVERGRFPRGCIWCPGDLDAPQYGTLYGPDATWPGARPIVDAEEVQNASTFDPDRSEQRGLTTTLEERNAAGFHFAGEFMDARASDRPGWFGRLPEQRIMAWIRQYREQRRAA